MNTFSEQLSRIKAKLPLAAKADPQLRVFGASSHKYRMGPPATEAEVLAFEQQYQLRLPECYRVFLLEIGNGSSVHAHPAAGPFYGIHPLGEKVNDVVVQYTEDYLKAPCPLRPDMTPEEWIALISKITAHDDQVGTDEDYERAYGEVYAGLLPIASQGCTYINGIILNGPYCGRVLNLDYDLQLPMFTYEAHFLDWYERWLDEVIAGELQGNNPGQWFGFTKGGTPSHLLREAHEAGSETGREQAFEALRAKSRLPPEIIDQIQVLIEANHPYRLQWVELLCKSDWERALPYLTAMADDHPGTLARYIWWYAQDKCGFWADAIKQRLDKINDAESLRYCGYLLHRANSDYGAAIAPFTRHTLAGVRSEAFTILSRFHRKYDLTEVFIQGLYDPEDEVVGTALQASFNLQEPKLLPHIQMLKERYPDKVIEDASDPSSQELSTLIARYVQQILHEYDPAEGAASRALSGNGYDNFRTPQQEQAGTPEEEPTRLLKKKKWWLFWK